MTLCLYNNLGNGKYENIFAWVPDEPQWWITGFNPEFPDPNHNIMTLVGSIDFSNNTEMYDKFKSSYDPDREYAIFDEENNTIWIIW